MGDLTLSSSAICCCQDVLPFGIERIELHLYRSECSAHFINPPAFAATKGGIHTYRPPLSKLVEQVLTFLLRRGNVLLHSLGFLLEGRHARSGGTLSAGRGRGQRAVHWRGNAGGRWCSWHVRR